MKTRPVEVQLLGKKEFYQKREGCAYHPPSSARKPTITDGFEHASLTAEPLEEPDDSLGSCEHRHNGGDAVSDGE